MPSIRQVVAKAILPVCAKHQLEAFGRFPLPRCSSARMSEDGLAAPGQRLAAGSNFPMFGLDLLAVRAVVVVVNVSMHWWILHRIGVICLRSLGVPPKCRLATVDNRPSPGD